MQTAAAYIRVSTDDQLEYSPDSQLDLLREYAKANGLLLPDKNVFRWENRTIEYLIRNPVYAGKLRFSKKGRIRRDYGNENMQVVDGKHPAIVSQELY